MAAHNLALSRGTPPGRLSDACLLWRHGHKPPRVVRKGCFQLRNIPELSCPCQTASILRADRLSECPVPDRTTQAHQHSMNCKVRRSSPWSEQIAGYAAAYYTAAQGGEMRVAGRRVGPNLRASAMRVASSISERRPWIWVL